MSSKKSEMNLSSATKIEVKSDIEIEKKIMLRSKLEADM